LAPNHSSFAPNVAPILKVAATQEKVTGPKLQVRRWTKTGSIEDRAITAVIDGQEP